MMPQRQTSRLLVACAASGLLGACNLAPAYHVPAQLQPLPASFKADPGWAPATPADAVAKGEWWRLFNDPVLDDLEAKVAVTNQNVASARAAWLEAKAVVSVDRAALFPTVSATAGATRSGTFGNGVATTGTGTGTTSTNGSTFTVAATGSWDLDLWGKIGNTVRQAKYTAQASAGDLANATLSAQATLATDYLTLRALDADKQLLDSTIAADRRTLQVVQNQYQGGTVSLANVYSAQSTLDSETAARRDLDRQRAANEDAVAVLVGENPSTFTIAATSWAPTIPAVPGVVPGDILQRRPDVAASERLVAAANANIGIQRAAFFPAISLTGSVGSSAGSLGNLFTAATSFWSLGGSAAETLIDFGARSAQVREARQAYNQTVANYRETVLTAFQQVEDELSALDAYAAEDASLTRAADAADHSATISRNELAAGTVDYTTVALAIAAANSARQSQIANIANRQTAAVALIEAIGGAWQGTVPLDPPTEVPAPATITTPTQR